MHYVRRPFGFSIDDATVRRAGLDYWSSVDLAVYDSVEQFVERGLPEFDRTFSRHDFRRKEKDNRPSGSGFPGSGCLSPFAVCLHLPQGERERGNEPFAFSVCSHQPPTLNPAAVCSLVC